MDENDPRFTQVYRCAQCWGSLQWIYRDGKWIVECRTGGQEHTGFVTANYVERRLQEDYTDYREAKDLLDKLGILDEKRPKKSAKQILDELGF